MDIQERAGADWQDGKILKWEIRLVKDSVVTFVFFSKNKSKVKSLCEVQTGLNMKDHRPYCPVIL